MEIARDQAQEGWLCAHGHRVEFVMLGGQPFRQLPSGHRQSAGPAAGATGHVDQVDPAVRGQPIEQAGARWLLRTEGSEPMEVERLSLLKLELRLDARRQLLGFEGLLARETALGDMTYPAGTGAVRRPARGRRPARRPAVLGLARARGPTAGGTDVAAGSSVLQAPDGAVRAVLSNREAGVLDVAAVGSGPRAPSLAGARKPPWPLRRRRVRAPPAGPRRGNPGPAAKRWDNSQLSPRAAQRAAVPSCSLIETKSWPLTCRSPPSPKFSLLPALKSALPRPASAKPTDAI